VEVIIVGGQLYLTKNIDNKLESLASTNKVHKEALGNTLLLLAMCNEQQVKQCVDLIRTWHIEGGAKMEIRDL
jgi:hypothetical protein